MEWIRLINWLEWEIRNAECKINNLEQKEIKCPSEGAQLVEYYSKLNFANRTLLFVKRLAD